MHAGALLEFGLADTQQTLMLNGLRSLDLDKVVPVLRDNEIHQRLHSWDTNALKEEVAPIASSAFPLY